MPGFNKLPFKKTQWPTCLNKLYPNILLNSDSEKIEQIEQNMTMTN